MTKKMDDFNGLATLAGETFMQLENMGVISISSYRETPCFQVTAKAMAELGVAYTMRPMKHYPKKYSITATMDNYEIVAVADKEEKEAYFSEGVVNA